MRLAIEHTTVCRPERPARQSLHKVRLTPRTGGRLRIMDWHLDLPGPAEEELDAFGNRTHLLQLHPAQSELRIHVRGIVETAGGDIGRRASMPAEATGDRRSQPALSPLIFLRTTALTLCSDAMRAFVQPLMRELLHDRRGGLLHLQAVLSTRIALPTNGQPPQAASDAFERPALRPEDFAPVFIALCRHCQIPARLVCGYRLANGATGRQTHAHSWAEAWCADEGWLAFDPAAEQPGQTGDISLAVGLDWLDACPIRGLGGAGQHLLQNTVHVQAMTQ